MTSKSKPSPHAIIHYWDTAGLCSCESSTSHADPDLAFFDNAIENQRLYDYLFASNLSFEHALDIGAGFGRFTRTLLTFTQRVCLLEAAKNLFNQLMEIWKGNEKVTCIHSDFENFSSESRFDLIITSGVLYLYDEDMLDEFLNKVQTILNDGGVFIIRDFVRTDKNQVLSSSYIAGGSCYYRTPVFWKEKLHQHGLELEKLGNSKPAALLLRNKKIIRGMHYLKLSWLLRNSTIIRLFNKTAKETLQPGAVHTVFIYASKRSHSL